MAILLLVAGVSGAGKTHLLSLLREERLNDAFVSIDALMGEFTPEAFRAAHLKALALIRSLLPFHPIVFVEDNFHQRALRQKYARLASSCEVPYGVLLVRAPLSICIARQATRSRPIPHSVINAQEELISSNLLSSLRPFEKGRVFVITSLVEANSALTAAFALEVYREEADSTPRTPASSSSLKELELALRQAIGTAIQRRSRPVAKPIVKALSMLKSKCLAGEVIT